MNDLAVIIVSTGERHWLTDCLPTVFDAGGDLDLDVVVVDNGSGDDTREYVEREFPRARVVDSANHGFPHANNRGMMTTDARYVLLLNPDTQIVNGSFAELLARMDQCPEVGLAGCRQIGPDGELHFTMRRFPTPIRLLAETLVSEKWPFRASWTGQRLLDKEIYATEFDLDWTQGSFMLCRREALEAAGWLDERLFLYNDDPDIALRIKRAGWRVRHLPQMEIVHHAEKMGWSRRGYAQYAFANRVYFEKHYAGTPRRIAVAEVAAGYGLRALLFPFVRRSEPGAAAAMRAAFATMIGLAGPPYEAPPAMAVRPRGPVDEANLAAIAVRRQSSTPLIFQEPNRLEG